jgi:hypothetical protein
MLRHGRYAYSDAVGAPLCPPVWPVPLHHQTRMRVGEIDHRLSISALWMYKKPPALALPIVLHQHLRLTREPFAYSTTSNLFLTPQYYYTR